MGQGCSGGSDPSSSAGASGNAESAGSADQQGAGIYDKGTIDTGLGRDILEALQSGFADGAPDNLDSGNHVLKGFGAGTF